MIALLFVLVILGFAWYVLDTYVPMGQPMKVLTRGVMVILIVWLLLRMVLGPDLSLPPLR